MLFRFPLK